MNVPLLFLPLFYLTKIVSGKVAVDDHSVVLPNKIASREDWYILSKYYASIHKPYNVQKYVPYRPSNQTTGVKLPLKVQPEIATEASVHDFDWDKYSVEKNIEQTNDTEINPTTETMTGTTESADVSSLLLSIIGSTPGIETTTSDYESIVVSTEENHFTYTGENNLLDNSNPSTTSEPEPESTTTTRYSERTTPDITTEVNLGITSSAPEMTRLLDDSTTRFPESTPSTLQTIIDAFESSPSTSQIEITTEMEIPTTEFSTSTEIPSTMSTRPETTTITILPNSTTEVPTSTTESALSTSMQPETTTITILPDSTTEVPTSTTESALSTSMQPETTTEVDNISSIATSQTSSEITSTESPFLLSSTVVEGTTEMNKVEEITTSKPIITTTQRSILVGDVFRPKPRKFTYSSDVMPETDWE